MRLALVAVAATSVLLACGSSSDTTRDGGRPTCTGMFRPEDGPAAFGALSHHRWKRSQRPCDAQGKVPATCSDELVLAADGAYERFGTAYGALYESGRWSFGLDADYPPTTAFSGTLCVEVGGTVDVVRFGISPSALLRLAEDSTPFEAGAALPADGRTLESLPAIEPPEGFRVMVGNKWRLEGEAPDDVPSTISFDAVGHWAVESTRCRNSGEIARFRNNYARASYLQAVELVAGTGPCGTLDGFEIDPAARRLMFFLHDRYFYVPM
jgi:hypothetical protein